MHPKLTTISIPGSSRLVKTAARSGATLNCLQIVHCDGRRAKVDRPCLLPTSGRIGGAPRICRSTRIQLIRDLRRRDEQSEPVITDANELAKALADRERQCVDFTGADKVTVLRWGAHQLAVITAGSLEFVERTLIEQSGFGNAILATHRTIDGTVSCVIVNWAVSEDAIRILNTELNRTLWRTT